MTITLRQRKKGKGRIYLYLEIYKGKETDASGKVKYLRDYEYLNLYLVEKPKTTAEKQHNKKILNLANNIKSKKELEYQSGRFGLKPISPKDTNFLEYYRHRVGKKKWCLQSVIDYIGEDKQLNFSDITKNWCEQYLEFLHTKKSKNRVGYFLNTSTIVLYWKILSSVINSAIKEDIISYNPCRAVKLPKVEDKEKIYLTLDELKSLVKTDCKHPILKRAFLFSCLTGLRWSDIYKLKWSEIQETEGKCFVRFLLYYFPLLYAQKNVRAKNFSPLQFH